MNIINNESVATGISLGLVSKAALDSSEVQYAKESNITAIASAQIEGQKTQELLGKYKNLLAGDAKRIGSLGGKFAEVDQMIGKEMKSHF